jgi:transcriptional regulator with XRE-family HTH domain
MEMEMSDQVRDQRNFAEKLIDIMETQNVDKQELAMKSGLCLASIQSYASGRRLPRISSRMKMAKALGVPSFDLRATPEDAQEFRGAPRVRHTPPPPKRIRSSIELRIERGMAYLSIVDQEMPIGTAMEIVGLFNSLSEKENEE